MFALIILTVSLKFFQSISLCYFLTNNCLILLGKFLHFSFNLWKIIFRDSYTLWRHNIIKKSIFYSWSKTKLDTRIELLKSLSQQVRRSMPEGMLSLLIFELIKFYCSVLSDWTIQFNNLTIYTARYNVASESR